MSIIIDTHSHIHFDDYDDDRGLVIQHARDVNVKMIAIGTDFQESAKAVAITREYPDVVLAATAGLHPTYNKDFDFNAFKKLASDEKIVAIGECGLDYYRVTDTELLKKQKDIFLQQINLAYELQKPLVIHCRQAFSDLIEILQEHSSKLISNRAGVIHFFSGSIEDMEKLASLGFYLGFGGVITFAKEYEEIIKQSPLSRIVVETDAPYVAPIPYRGKKNESAYIVEVVKKVAEIKNEDIENIKIQILENTKKLFNLSLPVLPN